MYSFVLNTQRSVDPATRKEPRHANELPARTECNRTRIATPTRRESTVIFFNNIFVVIPNLYLYISRYIYEYTRIICMKYSAFQLKKNQSWSDLKNTNSRKKSPYNFISNASESKY